jgi:hypothetical protein
MNLGKIKQNSIACSKLKLLLAVVVGVGRGAE